MEQPETEVEYDPERIFVRSLTSEFYSLFDKREELTDDNRVVRWADTEWQNKGGQMWNKDVFGSIQGGNPVMGKTQSLQVHIIDLAPEGESQKHVHQNEALMYVLEGKGYEIHDGKRYAWEPGDLVLIHGGCVHKHYSADPDNPARVLIVKAKPLYLFLQLLHQQYIEKAPDDPVPGLEDYEPGEWGSPTRIDLDPAHRRIFDRLARNAPESTDRHVYNDEGDQDGPHGGDGHD